MSNSNVEIRVKFEVGEIKFEAEGSADWVERERSIFTSTLLPSAVDAIVRTRGVVQSSQYIETAKQPAVLLPAGDSLSSESDNPNIPTNTDWLRTSLASFVKKKGADAHYDFMLCAVFYNEKKNNVSAFSAATLKDLYAEAKKPLPNNLSMSLSELIRKGLIMENPSAKGANPKEYVLTGDGEDTVVQMQPKEPKEKKGASKPRKSRPKAKSTYSNITCDELNLSRYPELKKQSTFKKQMLLTLYIVTTEGKGESFSVADIQYLMTDMLGLPASTDQINGIFKTNKSWFKAEQDSENKKAHRRKLLQGAKDFAQSIIDGTVE